MRQEVRSVEGDEPFLRPKRDRGLRRDCGREYFRRTAFRAVSSDCGYIVRIGATGLHCRVRILRGGKRCGSQFYRAIVLKSAIYVVASHRILTGVPLKGYRVRLLSRARMGAPHQKRRRQNRNQASAAPHRRMIQGSFHAGSRTVAKSNHFRLTYFTTSGENFGGRGRDRTGGLIVANDALSQLSYTPIRLVGF